MYTLEDLMSFGAYLLSDERIERRQEITEKYELQDEQLGKCHYDDVDQWLQKRGNAANPQ